MSPVELETRLHREIPLAAAMQVRVLAISSIESLLAAPLAPNINHKSTAFGGSLHSVAVLACWSLVTWRLQDEDVGYIVIQDSRIEYLKPVDSDFEARAVWASTEEEAAFQKTLVRRGLARAKLRAEILCRGEICATLEGSFVAQVE